MFDAKQTIFVAFFAIFTFLLSNHVFEGSLSSPTSLKKELQSRDHALSDWKLGQNAPFKYRILFKSLVQGTYRVLGEKGDQQFYKIYYGFSLILFVALYFLFWVYGQLSNISERALYLGIILLSASPPLLFAYTLPIHTREDILGYCLLVAGLISIKKNWRILLLFVMIAGVLTRETLMILPLYLLLRERGSLWSIGSFLLCTIVLVGLRMILGMEMHNPFEGLIWNLKNPIIAVGFSFLSFNILWVTYYYSQRLIKPHQEENLMVLIVIVTTLILGHSNEIRLFFLAFPWILIGSLKLYDAYQTRIFQMIRSRKLFIISISVLAIPLVIFANYLLSSSSFPNRYGIPLQLWLNAGLIYLFLSILVFISLYKIKFVR